MSRHLLSESVRIAAEAHERLAKRYTKNFNMLVRHQGSGPCG